MQFRPITASNIFAAFLENPFPSPDFFPRAVAPLFNPITGVLASKVLRPIQE